MKHTESSKIARQLCVFNVSGRLWTAHEQQINDQFQYFQQKNEKTNKIVSIMGNSNFWLWQTSKKRNCWASEGFHLDEGRFWRSIDEVRNYGWLQTSIFPPKKSQIDSRENQKKNHFPMPFRLLLPAYIVAVCISLSSTSVIILYE